MAWVELKLFIAIPIQACYGVDRNLGKTAAPSVGNKIQVNKNYISIKQTNPKVNQYLISLAHSLL